MIQYLFWHLSPIYIHFPCHLGFNNYSCHPCSLSLGVNLFCHFSFTYPTPAFWGSMSTPVPCRHTYTHPLSYSWFNTYSATCHPYTYTSLPFRFQQLFLPPISPVFRIQFILLPPATYIHIPRLLGLNLFAATCPLHTYTSPAFWIEFLSPAVFK